MSRLVSVICVLVPLLLACALGWRFANDHAAAKLAPQQQDAAKQYAHAVDDGASAVATVQAQAASQSANKATLDLELSHVRTPLVAVAACRPGAGSRAVLVDRAAVAGGPVAGASAPPEPGATPASQAMAGAPVDPDDGVLLSLGAVRLWNSALAGRSLAASLAADTCPADDPTASACAAGSGIELRAAWRNHIHNATSCAQDRSQLSELIELLQRRQANQGTKP